MRERALLVGGHLAVFSAPGAGTTIELTMADAGAGMRILIADDHGIVRGGLRLLIDRQPDMEVVAEAATASRRSSGALARGPTCACSTSRCRA